MDFTRIIPSDLVTFCGHSLTLFEKFSISSVEIHSSQNPVKNSNIIAGIFKLPEYIRFSPQKNEQFYPGMLMIHISTLETNEFVSCWIYNSLHFFHYISSLLFALETAARIDFIIINTQSMKNSQRNCRFLCAKMHSNQNLCNKNLRFSNCCLIN